MPTIDAIRSRFPALSGDTVLLENAGGSQVPIDVADAIRAYMLESYVQLGAGYRLSDIATRTVESAHAFVTRLFGGEGIGKTILGPSSTQLCHLIAGCLAERIVPGDEIVVAENGHEANIGPWLRLAKAGAVIRWWKVDRAAMDCPLAALDEVLSDRTRLVAFPHVSNLLGGIVDIEAVTRRAHSVGARVFVDGVAFAPHRLLDVAHWGVDWYVYSTYKVYGPHMGALFGRHDAIAELEGPNHFFIPKEEVPYKFELGGVSHEGCAGILALGGYLAFLAGSELGAATCSRSTIEAAFRRMTDLEAPLQRRLVEGLASLPRVRLVGPTSVSADERVPTVSFLHERRPKEVVATLRDAGIGIRHGHMYAHRLCAALGIATAEGVIRVSAVHYNTMDEVERTLEVVASA